MNKKTKSQISAAMTAAGVLTNNWSMLDQRVRELGGQPEDLYSLGRREDPEINSLVNATAEKLVALGRVSRATRPKSKSSAPPSMMFRPALHPKYLFLIHKDGADAPTLLTRMEPTYFISPYAKGMMEQKEFVIGPTETALIGVFTGGQLQMTEWPETDVFGPKGWEHVKQFSLTKCAQDDGQYIREAHSKQELGEWFRVGHDPIPFVGCSNVWRVGHDDGCGRCLDGWNLFPSDRLLAGSLVAFRLAS